MKYDIMQTTNKTQDVTGVKSFAEFNHFHHSKTYDSGLGVVAIFQTINEPGTQSNDILQVLHEILLNKSLTSPVVQFCLGFCSKSGASCQYDACNSRLLLTPVVG